MSSTWLIDVLDRALPDMIGADRDRLALAILVAVPVERLASVIGEAAFVQLRAHGIATAEERHRIAKDIGANASMAVCGALDMHADDDQDVIIDPQTQEAARR